MIEVNLEATRSRRDRRPQPSLDRHPAQTPSPDRLTAVANGLALATIVTSLLAIAHFIGLI